MRDPRVVVIGAGLAGLTAAHTLQQHGLRSVVYEADERVGGRVCSARGVLAPGLTTELGGEFIDSSHADVLALVRELGLELLDLHDQPPGKTALLIGERARSEDRLASAFGELAARIAGDYARLPAVIDYRTADPLACEFDRLSLAAYLERLEVAEPLRGALLTDYTVENGLDPDEQSSLNLILPVGAAPQAGFTGDTDRRYRVRGGNQQIPERLAERLEVRPGHRLVGVRAQPTGFTAHFENGARARADYLILALPFTLLRQVELPELPEPLTRAVRELTYGTNSKLALGFTERFWDQTGRSGSFLCDGELQDGWDSSRLQPGAPGGLTLYFGGRRGLELGAGTPDSQARRLLDRLDQVLPGAARHYNGVALRKHWPSAPFALGSYSGYRVGEWTRLAGATQVSAGNLLFAGEHVSRDWQGFMNGAAETGRLAAERILAGFSAPR